NCSKRSCPYRLKGVENDIDVNVAPMTKAALRKIWAFGDLLPEKPFEPLDMMLTASVPPVDRLKATVDAIAAAGAEVLTTVEITLASGEPAGFPIHLAAAAQAGAAATATANVSLGRNVVEATPVVVE